MKDISSYYLNRARTLTPVPKAKASENEEVQQRSDEPHTQTKIILLLIVGVLAKISIDFLLALDSNIFWILIIAILVITCGN